MRSLKKTIAVLALAAMLVGMLPAFAFAAGTVKLTVPGNLYLTRGTTVYLDVEAEAPADTSYKLVLSGGGGGIDTSDASTGVLSGNAKQSLSISASSNASTGYHDLTLRALATDGTVLAERTVPVEIVESRDSFSSLGQAAIDVTYAVSGSEALQGGQTNYLKLTLFNRGNTNINNARVTLTLPAGITIQSGASTRNIGNFSMGKTVTVDYPLLLDEDIVTGSYPIEVQVSGVKGDTTPTTQETIYIPVEGKAAADSSSPVLIVDSFDYGSGRIAKGASFTLKMKLLNTGSKDIHNIIVNVLDASGAVVPSGTSYIKVDSIAAGQSEDVSIGLRAIKDASPGQANLSVDMQYMDPDNKQLSSSYPILVQLVSSEEGKGDVVNPILMVSGYSYGGSNVLAGSTFPLSITFTNTSGKTLRNIKVTVADSVGAIIPDQGGSSVFIASIPAGGSVSKTMNMTVSRTADPRSAALGVAMSYEDLDGGTYSASDTVTVPITQQDRLVVDDILDPGWLTAGDQGYVSIKYYNMGQTTLNNLRVAVSGDFTVDGDSSQYVGNMAPGRSDYFSFNFWPNEAGVCKGTATFTFENSVGEEKTIEKTFEFNVGEAYVPEDPGFIDEPVVVNTGLPLWAKALIGAGVVVALFFGGKAIRKHRKAKQEALDLDE